MKCLNLLLIFNRLVFLLIFDSSLYILNTSLCQKCDLQMFSTHQFVACLFHSHNSVFRRARVFSFDEVQCIHFFLLWIILLVFRFSLSLSGNFLVWSRIRKHCVGGHVLSCPFEDSLTSLVLRGQFDPELLVTSGLPHPTDSSLSSTFISPHILFLSS